MITIININKIDAYQSTIKPPKATFLFMAKRLMNIA